VIGIIELGGGFQQSDLTAYFESLGVPTANVVAASVDGGKNSPDASDDTSSNPDFEVNLDIDVAGVIAPGAKQVIYIGSDASDQSFLNAVI
jgi:kumamolisin